MSPADHVSRFYDELAPLYHLIFENWGDSVEWQGKTLAQVIRSRWPDHHALLDVSCGMGTQAIGLAAEGFRVNGSDLSVCAVARAREEAVKRGQTIDFSICDMREAFAHHGGGFDLVISCDNSVPHLLTDDDVGAALGQMFACLRPGGGCLLTIRDYAKESRGRNIIKPIRAVTRAGQRSIVFQVWDFEGERYDLTLFVIEENLVNGDLVSHAMRSRYYAISIDQLIRIMRLTGFQDIARIDDAFYQPIVVGTRPA